MEQSSYLIDGSNRRWFLKQSSALVGAFWLPPLVASADPASHPLVPSANTQSVTLNE